VEIAREMKTKKTGHNVKGYKLRFLRDHPNWRKEFAHLNGKLTPPVIVSDEESPPRESLKKPTREPEEVPATPEEDHSITIITTPAEESPTSVVEEESTAGTSVICITIAYPLQSSLECPHCTV